MSITWRTKAAEDREDVMETHHFELGLDSFGEVAGDNGHPLSDAETVRLPVDGARKTWWEYWQPTVERLSAERRFCPPTREQYEAELDDGAFFVSSPETVAQKIALMTRDLHLSRFDLEYDIMRLPRGARARTIELLGHEVAPRVRELLAKEALHV